MMAIAAYGSQKEDDLSTEDTLGAHGEAGRVPISQIARISWRENGSQSWLRDIDFIASSACTGQTWIWPVQRILADLISYDAAVSIWSDVAWKSQSICAV